MTTISFEPCKLKYSLVEGVFVVTDRGAFMAICQSEALLWEYLETFKTCRSLYDVRVLLVDMEDWSEKDDVTHVLFEAKRGDFETYEEWVKEHGYENPFMEFWFDEATGSEYTQDMIRRYRRWRDCQAPFALASPAPRGSTVLVTNAAPPPRLIAAE